MGNFGIPLGEAPPAVRQQEQALKALLQSGRPALMPSNGRTAAGFTEDLVPEVVEEVSSDTPALVPAPLSECVDNEVIQLQYVPEKGQNVAPFQLDLKVGEVCIRPYYISIQVLSDFAFRPNGPMQFVLRHRDTEYPVHFVGAEFEFKKVNVRGLSFIRILK